MCDSDKIINSPTTITIHIHTHTQENAYALTYITEVYTHIQFKILTRGPIGLFSNKWENGTKYFGLYRASVENAVIEELGKTSEFL